MACLRLIKDVMVSVSLCVSLAAGDGKVSWHWGAKGFHKVTVGVAVYWFCLRERFPQCKCNNSAPAGVGFPSKVISSARGKVLQLC